jgi:hypothetical protein
MCPLAATTKTHVPQFAFAFFAKSLVARIAKVELLYTSTVENGFPPKAPKKLRNVG